MSVGGRGSSSRGNILKRGNVPLPNLSIAGKRETKCEPTGTRGARRGGKRERGGRGRSGHGNRSRERGRQQFIEQQGIFSSGLNDDGRHDRTKKFRIANLGRVKKVDPESVTNERGGNSTTYESEWLSDEEGDNEELRELLRDGFLSDLKPGKVIPLVLPETEQEQFQQLVIKEEKYTENGGEMDTGSMLPTKKKKKDNQQLKSECMFEEDIKKPQLKALETVNIALNPTETSSQRAAAIIRKIKEDEDSAVLMLQLPSTLSAVRDSTSQQDTVISGSKTDENISSTTKHCLDGFVNGSKIGKLRIRKGGRMELLVCGMPLDVTCGVSTRYNESVLLIDSESQTTSAIKSECGEEQVPSRGYILGRIVDSLICSHNIPEALDGKREEQQRNKREPFGTKRHGDEGEDLEMKDLLLELRSIEKKEESWSKWTLEYSDSVKYDDS
uniref:DNA-directed RNA polymerase III subunit RPC4 n=1 Tax=Setaria digitata TaxID=48799 RepID=A0A915PXH3_9BILA